MLTLNSMFHQPHQYSASMIMTGCENTLPHGLITGAQPFEGPDTPSTYVTGILEWIREMHRGVAPAEVPTHPNTYQPDDLIWVSTPHLERTSKLTPRWIGPSRVHKVPNRYQVMYSTNSVFRMVHIRLTKQLCLNCLLPQKLLRMRASNFIPLRILAIRIYSYISQWECCPGTSQ